MYKLKLWLTVVLIVLKKGNKIRESKYIVSYYEIKLWHYDQRFFLSSLYKLVKQVYRVYSIIVLTLKNYLVCSVFNCKLIVI